VDSLQCGDNCQSGTGLQRSAACQACHLYSSSVIVAF